MNFLRRLLLSGFLLFGTWILAFGQNVVLRQSNESGIYKKGQKIEVKLFVKNPGTDSTAIKILNIDNGQIIQKNVAFHGDTLVIYQTIFDGPVSLIFEAKTRNETVSIGALAEPGKYMPGLKRPDDFDRFWKAEKKALRALPVKVKMVPVKVIEPGYACSDMEINCAGPKPARGYFAKPESAKPKSLPIVLYVHAAGVKGSWCRSEPGNALNFAKMGKGALCFDLNAHGMLNGQTEEYYTNLENGELKNYFQQGLESRSDYYFRGMFLRLIRTLDFLESQPEWDGKRILVLGESQGGGQALAAAGLDHRVSAVVATVPAMCDLGANLAGRKETFPYPFSTKNNKEKMMATVPYFDVAHLLKGAKATLVVEIGLIDVTCPATSIYAAINQANGRKIVYAVPYRGHHQEQPAYQKTWESTVYKPKEDFIREYLK
jgi:cephalosporin-C deacetylase-like acetyl esterase